MIKGYKFSEESKKKMRYSALKPSRIIISKSNLPKDVSGEKNGFFGKKHTKKFIESRTGDRSPVWSGGLPSCKICNNILSGYNVKICRNCHRGENHKRWKGGYQNKLLLNIQRRIKNNSCIGFHTLNEWELLKKKHNYQCLCCRKSEPEIKLSRDHIIPISLGGDNFISNIQPLCRSCNSKKMVKIINYENK